MLSGKLIHLVEAHQEQVAANIIREIRQHSELGHLRRLSDAELRERIQQILENLDDWLAGHFEEDIARRYEQLGRVRFEQSIPLSETIRALCITKEKMIEFVELQGLTKTFMELYAEGEFERRLGRFFDTLIIHVVHGYETAARRAHALT